MKPGDGRSWVLLNQPEGVDLRFPKVSVYPSEFVSEPVLGRMSAPAEAVFLSVSEKVGEAEFVCPPTGKRV